jgi:hypothetical protein
MQLERQRLASQEKIAMENIQSREETEGARMGIETARSHYDRLSQIRKSNE